MILQIRMQFPRNGGNNRHSISNTLLNKRVRSWETRPYPSRVTFESRLFDFSIILGPAGGRIRRTKWLLNPGTRALSELLSMIDPHARENRDLRFRSETG